MRRSIAFLLCFFLYTDEGGQAFASGILSAETLPSVSAPALQCQALSERNVYSPMLWQLAPIGARARHGFSPIAKAEIYFDDGASKPRKRTPAVLKRPGMTFKRFEKRLTAIVGETGLSISDYKTSIDPANLFYRMQQLLDQLNDLLDLVNGEPLPIREGAYWTRVFKEFRLFSKREKEQGQVRIRLGIFINRRSHILVKKTAYNEGINGSALNELLQMYRELIQSHQSVITWDEREELVAKLQKSPHWKGLRSSVTPRPLSLSDRTIYREALILPEEVLAIEKNLDMATFYSLIRKGFNSLFQREKEVLNVRFGLEDGITHTIQETEKLTRRSYAQRTINNALRKIFEAIHVKITFLQYLYEGKNFYVHADFMEPLFEAAFKAMSSQTVQIMRTSA